MAADSISSAAPIMAASVMQYRSRPPETTPDARESAAQENDARRTAEAVSGAAPASVGTRLQIVPAPNDAEASLQASSSQIARAQSGAEQQNVRAASEAYQSQAAAQSQITQQEQANGSQSVNVMA
jgi:hypothetical protein